MSNGHLDKVKASIRKLLALAADDAVSDGEITTAMALAEKAMDAYHLERVDLDAQTDTHTKESYDRQAGACVGARMSTWEIALYGAIKELVGSVHAYCTTIGAPSGTWKVGKPRAAIMWYGPAEDAQLAADLFEEW